MDRLSYHMLVTFRTTPTNKMPTTLIGGSGALPVDCLQYVAFASDLGDIIKRGSPAALDFSNLLYPKLTLNAAKILLGKNIISNRNDAIAVSLFNNLEAMSLTFTDDQSWWKFLGEIVESTVIKLMEDKYKREILQEKSAQVTINGKVVADLDPKTMDAMAWDISRDQGEMHEIKKAVVSQISKPKIKEKLIKMSKFKRGLESASGVTIFMGMTTLFETSAVAKKLVNQNLKTGTIDILGRDGIIVWLSRSYL